VSTERKALQVVADDISSTYLEAYSQGKVCFMTGPEFGNLEGQLLVIERVLYGLRSSGASWHEQVADTLPDMVYDPCRADPEVWLEDWDTNYEYVFVHVDDLMAIGKNPIEVFNTLTEKHQYKLKGV
jgi:Reverse transcriptase (RNA-dependent DNA polymerase)